MLACPSCSKRLVRVSTSSGVVYACGECGGRAVSMSVLRKEHTPAGVLKSIWQQAREGAPGQNRQCPHCMRRMSAARFQQAEAPVVLDVCTRCQFVWFDGGEYDAVALPPPAASVHGELSPEARKALARLKVEGQAEIARAKDTSFLMDDGEGPAASWQTIPGVLGVPVEIEAPAAVRKPLVTWSLSAFMVIAVVGLLVTGNLDAAARDMGFIPNQWDRHGGLTLLTSFFLHGGLVHLASNLYFFLIFGDNVEDHVGKLRFLMLVAVSHLVGILLHCVFDPNGDVPLVGASAGISGVIGYYAVAFPHAKIGMMRRVGLAFRWFRMSAWFALVLYVILQFIGSWLQVQGFSNVSYLAHLGGLSVGIAAGLYVCMSRTARDVR